MPVNRESVTGGELQPQRVLAGFAWIALDYGELHPRIKPRWREVAPGETAVRDHVNIGRHRRGGHRQWCGAHRSVDGDPPLAVDLVPHSRVIATIGHFALRAV